MLRSAFQSSIRRSRVAPQYSRPFCSKNSNGDHDGTEYSSSKEIGNPITWANPAGGPSQDDRTSNTWKWVYPIGFGLILAASLVSRYRNKEKQDEEDVASLDKQAQKDRSIRMHQAMERLNFATKSKADQDKIAHDYDRDY